MQNRERTHFLSPKYKNQLITVIEKGEVLGKIPFEKLRIQKSRNLIEVLHIDLYSDGAGI
jgi:hypothetical protein